MALKVSIVEKQPHVSEWKEYKHAGSDEVLARFKIRGIAYKPYQLALDVAREQLGRNDVTVATVSNEDRFKHEYMFEAAAYHLIEDWEGVFFSQNGKEVEQKYSGEAAYKLFNEGDIGALIWLFVHNAAQEIQKEANEKKDKLVGKSLNTTTTKKAKSEKQNTAESSSKRSE